MKPMLAALAELSHIKYPVYASPKLDGIRGVVVDGILRSRSLKPIPNPYVTARFSKPELDGLDGELILGDPTAKDVYRVTNGACSRHDGEPDVKFYAFDNYKMPGSYEERWIDHMLLAKEIAKAKHLVLVPQLRIDNETQLMALEEVYLDKGYEGLILHDPAGKYKFGRSTVKEGGMLKLKRFLDSEAEILEVYEEMENTNEKTTNELGRSARSSHKAGKVGKSRAGGFHVRDHKTNVCFSIGTGLNDDDKAWYWKKRKAVIGKFIKYKYFPVGVKDAPRHPVYLGGREDWDL